ncbi:hypothetical protein Plhal304r1_c051g0134291 [Plasmopara halstedii]
MKKLQGVDISNWDDRFSRQKKHFWAFAEDVLYVIQAQRLIDVIRFQEIDAHNPSIHAYETQLKQTIFDFWRKRKVMTKAKFADVISYTDEKNRRIIALLWKSFQEYLNKN